MASCSEELKEKFEKASKFLSLLKDAENFYADVKDKDESHKTRALQYFSQDEIDKYCQLTFSVDDCNDKMPYYQRKISDAKASIDRIKAKLEHYTLQIKQLEEEKAKPEPHDLEEIEGKILYFTGRIKYTEDIMKMFIQEINKYQAKLDEGEKLNSNREKLIGTLKSRYMNT